MIEEWKDRNQIVANLLNPAFCGEILRRTAKAYNQNSSSSFPYAYCFLVLPILLHRSTRERMPKTTRSYLFAWVEENDDLFYDFSRRAKNMVPHTKEAILFLLQNELVQMDDKGAILTPQLRMKSLEGESLVEYQAIMKKSEMLGKWLSHNPNINSVYSFFRITP